MAVPYFRVLSSYSVAFPFIFWLELICLRRVPDIRLKWMNSKKRLKITLNNLKLYCKMSVQKQRLVQWVNSVCMLMSALRHDWDNPSGSCMLSSYINMWQVKLLPFYRLISYFSSSSEFANISLVSRVRTRRKNSKRHGKNSKKTTRRTTSAIWRIFAELNNP